MTALMLAEPEASVRGFLAQQLTSDGFDVLAFENADKLPRAAEPDVLVLGDPAALDRCRIGNCAVIVLGRADAVRRTGGAGSAIPTGARRPDRGRAGAGPRRACLPAARGQPGSPG